MLKGKVTFLKPAELAFVRMTGPYPVASKAAWKILLNWMDKAGHVPIGHVGYGMAIDDPRTVAADDLRYDACVVRPHTWTVADAEIVQLKNFDGGAYLSIHHVGNYDEIGRIVSEARDIIVPRQGLIQDAERALLTMYYSYPSRTRPEEQIADICIPVIPDRREKVRVPH